MTRRVLPNHVGFIPDGNRRWAVNHGLPKESGYQAGIGPGLALYEMCESRGIPEVSVYGFTQDNTKRPSVQIQAFRSACVSFATEIARRGAALLVVGDERSSHFPDELLPFRTRQGSGTKVNFLVNYHWEWDLAGLERARPAHRRYPDSISSSAGVEEGASAASCQSNQFMPTSTLSISTGPTSGRRSSKKL